MDWTLDWTRLEEQLLLAIETEWRYGCKYLGHVGAA